MLLPSEAALVVWNTGTSVELLGLAVVVVMVASSFSLAAIMSATEAATSILLGVDGGLVVKLETRILGERFVKNVGKRGRNKVSVLVAVTVLAVVLEVVVVGLEVTMAWKRSGVLLGSKRGPPVPLAPPLMLGSRIGRIVPVESLASDVPLLAPRVTLV